MSKVTAKKEVRLQGTPISRGIAIGSPYLFKKTAGEIPERSLGPDEVKGEVERYRAALEASRRDLQKLQGQMASVKALEAAAILDSHLHIMQDPLLTANIEKEIRNQKKNAEFVFYHVLAGFQQKFKAMPDTFFRERGKDLYDISKRILGHLLKGSRYSLLNIPESTVVFSREVLASEIAEVDKNRLTGVITETDGIASHAVIVAKAKRIPYITNVKLSEIEKEESEVVIVDGRTGEVILNPSEETIAKYRVLHQQIEEHFFYLKRMSQLEAETYDGFKIRLSANIEMANELDLLQQYGGTGVGLFRSEYIFLAKKSFPSEEEQFAIYKSIVEKTEGLPIVIRTFDLGGDKLALHPKGREETNPYLGCRALKFLSEDREIFKTQLRAILRASVYGDVSIMFPMVPGLPELMEAKKMVEEARRELSETHGEIKPIRIGCMIEVPSAAITSDLLANECDFLSIGTNDLVQYSLAADRSHHSSSMLYSPTHPSVIRLIKLVVSQANHYGIPVTVCGEVAADPRFTPLLLGLGVQELSVGSSHLPVVKNAIRDVSIVEATKLAERVLRSTTSTEIQEALAAEYQRHAPKDFFYNF